MAGPTNKLSEDDALLLTRIFELLKSQLQSNPYGWDGSFAQEIQRLPTGLRAMAATHHLDVSLTLDDIGWHFLNFGHASHVEETERGLRELGLLDVADMFREAHDLVSPHLHEIRRPGGDFYGVIEEAGHMKRIAQLTNKARTRLGDGGIYRQWIDYTNKYPVKVFNGHES
jgi:hypothetical protein